MDSRDIQLLERYRPRFGDMSLSDEDMLKVIQIIVATSSSIVDDIFKNIVAGQDDE